MIQSSSFLFAALLGLIVVVFAQDASDTCTQSCLELYSSTALTPLCESRGLDASHGSQTCTCAMFNSVQLDMAAAVMRDCVQQTCGVAKHMDSVLLCESQLGVSEGEWD